MSSQDVDPVDGFEEALHDLDFDRAGRLAAQVGGALREELVEQIRTGRAEAMDRAEKLAARIQSLARADHYEGLLALASDPSTEPLLALLSVELRRGAKLHLDGAIRRRKRFRAAARRHMRAASEALVLFDTARAATELDKVVSRWLSESQLEDLRRLRIQIEQVDAERQEIENRTAAVLREQSPGTPSEPVPPGAEAGMARANRIRLGGCLGSVLLSVALLTLTLLRGRCSTALATAFPGSLGRQGD